MVCNIEAGLLGAAILAVAVFMTLIPIRDGSINDTLYPLQRWVGMPDAYKPLFGPIYRSENPVGFWSTIAARWVFCVVGLAIIWYVAPQVCG